ncbi:Splicing factor 3a, subunit 2 [Trachipleistophora hominis]|uniref:Splicing factor 3a, subunit 2 n=1 Tax=Trachipleistophora hominis TaxID=72359 RepID=L7JTT2_TRAHO|nr:Splicing factor 3a, subunit 2 [Trachipleistophora hominis]
MTEKHTKITPAIIKENRRKRLKQLINRLHDLKNDKYLRINHLGKIECKLCYTTHTNESSYVIHRSSTRHQLLAEKQFKRDRMLNNQPKYKMYNVRDDVYQGFLVKIKTKHDVMYKIVKALEQNVELVNQNYNYLVFKVREYDNIGLRVDVSEDYKIIKHFDGYNFKLQILYRIKEG